MLNTSNNLIPSNQSIYYTTSTIINLTKYRNQDFGLRIKNKIKNKIRGIRVFFGKFEKIKYIIKVIGESDLDYGKVNKNFRCIYTNILLPKAYSISKNYLQYEYLKNKKTIQSNRSKNKKQKIKSNINHY